MRLRWAQAPPKAVLARQMCFTESDTVIYYGAENCWMRWRTLTFTRFCNPRPFIVILTFGAATTVVATSVAVAAAAMVAVTTVTVECSGKQHTAWISSLSMNRRDSKSVENAQMCRVNEQSFLYEKCHWFDIWRTSHVKEKQFVFVGVRIGSKINFKILNHIRNRFDLFLRSSLPSVEIHQLPFSANAT